MQWSDQAILLSSRKHGESSAVLRLFSQEHGVYGGVVRGAASKKNRGIFQPGNVLNAVWNARLSEQLGSFTCELLQAHAALIMDESARISALSSACSLIESALPERHPYPRLYNVFHAFLAILSHEKQWNNAYVQFELALLAETGFGLDLSRCAATDSTENLIYVSPKTGRAVSRDAGAPYHEKLLPLPAFMLPQPTARTTLPDLQETLAGLRLTGYFLEHWLLAPHHRTLPAARARLIQTLNKTKALHGTEA